MIDIPKGKEGEKGTWSPVAYPKMVWCEFTCPFGHGSTLARNVHTVSEDGKVSPSLVCTQNCTFHEFVRLTDWKPEYADYVMKG